MEYDAAGRLTYVEYHSGNATEFTYDRRDNIIRRTYSHNSEVVEEVESEYDDENRMISMGELEYDYDDSGNQLGVESAGGSEFLSTYMNGEKWNLRMEVQPDIEAGIPWATYNYTLDGRRVGKAIAWTEEPEPEDVQLVYYLYDGQNVVYEFGIDHHVRYTHPLTCDGGVGASRRLGDPAERSSSVCGPTAHVFIDAPISIVVNGAKYYYLYVDMYAEHTLEFRNSFRINGLGSVTELIDEDENVVNVYRYTPFGESLYKDEQVFNPYQYTGRRFDNETGQYYYRARMYSPQQARFLSSDPLGMIDGPNMYAYVRNNPINARDPSGRMSGFWYSRALINGGGSAGYYGPREQWWMKSYWRQRIPHILSAIQDVREKDVREDYGGGFGTFSFIRERVWGVNLYAGYKWSFTREETESIALLGVAGFTASCIAKLGILKAIGPVGWILGYIGAIATVCSYFGTGSTVYFTHLPMPFPGIPNRSDYICD